MSFKESHKRRVGKIKNFTNKNKVFTVIAIIVVIYLLFNIVSSRINENDKKHEENSIQSDTVSEESNAETDDDLHWRFYWADLWVLAGAGGFCTVMIIRERKKAREKL